jgi:hypothetical protein
MNASRTPVLLLLAICFADPSSGGFGGSGDHSHPYCAGDSDHYTHGWTDEECNDTVNPHYSTLVDAGRNCEQRTRTCPACGTCCQMQYTEAYECHCSAVATSPLEMAACNAGIKAARRRCTDRCTYGILCTGEG